VSFGAMQLVCAGIVVAYWAMRGSAHLARAAWLAAAAWIGEDTVIRAYSFYEYDPRWSLFVDRVPLLIVLIWPVVVDSAWALAEELVESAHVPVAVGAIVLADASLIEPVAVHAGLWRWSEPGLFAVPPVGILGWAFFAASVVALARRAAPLALLGAVPTHALLVVAWWSCLRWVSVPLPSWSAAAVAWAVAAAFAALAVRARLRERVPPEVLLRRVPAAGFFFLLLAVVSPRDAALAVYAAAFAPPYLAMLRMRRPRTC